MKRFISTYLILLLIYASNLFAVDVSGYKSNLHDRLITPEPILNDFIPANDEQERKYQSLLDNFFMGDSLFLIGEIKMAGNNYNSGLIIAKDLNLLWHSIILHCRLGFMYYWTTDMELSEEHYEASRHLITKTTGIKDTLSVIESYTQSFLRDEIELSDMQNPVNLKSLLSLDGSYFSDERRSKFYFLRALSLNGETKYNLQLKELHKSEKLLDSLNKNSQLWLFFIRSQQAEYYNHFSDYNLANEYLKELALQVNNEKKFNCFKFRIYYQLGESYIFLRKYDMADKYFNEISESASGISHEYYIGYNLLIGYVYEQLGDYKNSRVSYKLAENICSDKNIRDERLARVYWHLASISRSLNHEDAELHYLTEAEKILQIYPNPYLESFVIKSLGLYYYKREDYSLAIFIFNFMLDDVEKLIDNEEYFRNQYPYIVTADYQYILRKRGHAFYYISKNNNFDIVTLNQSYLDLKNLLKLRIKIYDQLSYEQSKKTLLYKIRTTYDEIINVGYDLFEKTGDDAIAHELFQFAEKSKAYILKSYISDDLAKKLSGVPENLIQKSKDLKKDIDSLQYNLKQHGLQDGQKHEYFAINKIVKKIKDFDGFTKQLEKDYPQYLKFKDDDKDISISQIQDLLKPTQALIEYHYTYNAFYIFFIDKSAFKLFLLPLTRDFPKKVKTYRKLMAEMEYGDFSRNAIVEFSQQSISLYNLMIEPVGELIINKRLIIIPDGELISLPFESLVKPNKDILIETMTFKDLDYLIKSNSISYLYSASQLIDNTEIKRRKVRYAGFAPNYGGINYKINRMDSVHFSLLDLPGAVEEVKSIKNYFKGKVYIGDAASKKKFFRESAKSDIVHLAMHTLLDHEEPMNSQLIFSPESGSEKQLHAYEVYARKITASMMVLSACNTGAGEVVRGEGVFNIARAFIQAGVKNILITQWSVADHSSSYLMGRFYYYLSEGDAVDIALQSAKIDFLTKGDPVKAHPFFWAGYVSIGNPISYNSRNFAWVIYILLATIIVFGMLWRKRKLKS